MTSPWIPRAELARMLGLHPKTLQVMHRRGILRGVPVTPGGRGATTHDSTHTNLMAYRYDAHRR